MRLSRVLIGVITARWSFPIIRYINREFRGNSSLGNSRGRTSRMLYERIDVSFRADAHLYAHPLERFAYLNCVMRSEIVHFARQREKERETELAMMISSRYN